MIRDELTRDLFVGSRWSQMDTFQPLNMGLHDITYSFYIQEAQLSQRDRTTLRVIEYFAKLLMVTQNDTVE